ncbi:hypothetical protein TWF506_005446 [Arthrobotrys conoides]|uniref:Uncharacterized protein n=1 Tax=Arthrobotrys conoides TaxID=74498 RepID=A0AAN8NJM9_9PEZI
MSATLAQHESEFTAGPSSAQRPPRIPKPKTLKHGLSQSVVQEAFEVDYYLSKTDNWKHFKIAAVVKVLRSCCEGPILEHKSEFEPIVIGFKHQSEHLKNKVYDKFINNIYSGNISPKLRELLFDMLESTSEDRWLFIWLAGLMMRGWRRLPNWHEGLASYSPSSAQLASDETPEPTTYLPAQAERKSPLGIDERK